jgi:hypothetical protein
MFDYKRWARWLEARSVELETEGFETHFGAGPDSGSKPGMTLALVGQRAMGDFQNWVTGETDYTVFAPPTPKAQMVAHEWGLVVSDDTFEPTFNKFLMTFRRAESGAAY